MEPRYHIRCVAGAIIISCLLSGPVFSSPTPAHELRYRERPSQEEFYQIVQGPFKEIAFQHYKATISLLFLCVFPLALLLILSPFVMRSIVYSRKKHPNLYRFYKLLGVYGLLLLIAVGFQGCLMAMAVPMSGPASLIERGIPRDVAIILYQSDFAFTGCVGLLMSLPIIWTPLFINSIAKTIAPLDRFNLEALGHSSFKENPVVLKMKEGPETDTLEINDDEKS